MRIQTAPEREKVTADCSVTLELENCLHATHQESYRISSKQDEHDPKNGVLWEKSCWGERLMNHAVGDVVELQAPEENVIPTKIIAIDRG